MNYLYDVVHFNFGTDVTEYPAKVSTLIGETIPWTLTLVGSATVIAFLLGTLLGILAGWRHGGWLDRALPGLMFLQAVPYFFLALILIEVLAIKLNIFPIGSGLRPGSRARLELVVHQQRHRPLAAAGADDRASPRWPAGCCRCATS